MAKEDDIQALPNVDLGIVIDDLEKNNQPQQTVQDKPADLAQFKTPDDLLKGYKEVQGAFTRTSQENKALKEQLSRTNEEMELLRMQQQYQPQVPQYQQVQPQQQGEEPIEMVVQRTVALQRAAEVLEEEAEKNRPEFNERYAYAQMAARQYPQLLSTGRGIRKLFEIGDKLRQDNLKRNANKALESIFGEPLGDEAINKLRTLVKGNPAISQTNPNTNAYMPDTSTSTISGQNQNRTPNAESRRKDLVEKGDVEGVISSILLERLAE